MVRQVLVVDDEPTICEAVRMVLESDQYDVETASSGRQALDAFPNNKFDLVIVDYLLPDMKGDKLAAAIRTLSPQQPIIMLTGYGEALRFAGSFPLPVDLVVSKPFASQELREAVRKLLSKT